MATSGAIRRGLPRVPGGEPWPPADVVAAQDAGPRSDSPAAQSAAPAEPEARSADPHSAPLPVSRADGAAPAEPDASSTAPAGPRMRRGLPRVPGGEPWPPAGGVAARDAGPATHSPAAQSAAPAEPEARSADPHPAPLAAARAEGAAPAAAAAIAGHAPTSGITVRRGLPRTPGGEPWPPTDFVPAAPLAAAPGAAAPAAPAPVAPAAESPAAAPIEAPAAAVEVAAAASVAVVPAVRAPLPFPQTVFPGAAAARWNADRARGVPVAAPVPRRIGPFTRGQWAGAVIVGGLSLLFAAGMLVLAVRWFLSLGFMQDFVATYPGQYALPVGAPVGFPAWVGWQHFFNVFLMVLIIRSGLRVRSEKRPTVFWSTRGNPKRKISLTLWFHQSLDILWLVNGVIFVVLLFVTGQWLRIVPTSWEVFPNAITAALKYVSLDWPTEDGWVNYNALQQLAYFATVFLAAPLAAITGVRMSGVWPKNAKGLNRAYPVEWARAIHFPVMIFFVLFIIVHVALVFATGALRNLNHMYGGSDAVNWAGFWIFVASMVVIAAGWVAARPLVLAPIARLFGKVSGR